MRPVLFTLLLAACGTTDEPTDTDRADTDAVDDTGSADDTGTGGTDSATFSDSELAADLLTAIDGWETWTSAPGWDDVQPTPPRSPHGSFVEIRANATALTDWEGNGDLAADSIVVKALHSAADGSTPTGRVYAMWKVPGYAPETGDWFWAVYDDGVASTTGAPAGCTGCHGTGADYVRAREDRPPEP
jgi:hypothetical protein